MENIYTATQHQIYRTYRRVLSFRDNGSRECLGLEESGFLVNTSNLPGSPNITVTSKHPYEATSLQKTCVQESVSSVIRNMKWPWKWVQLLKNTHEVLR